MDTRRPRARLLATLAAAWIAVGALPAFAQNSDYATAVQTFNAGQYPQAADMFVQYLRQNPNDAMAHYYLGVTWHCLGRAQEAANEYNWVVHNSQDQELLKRANMGLTVVSRTLTPPAQAAQPPGYSPQFGQPQQYGQQPQFGSAPAQYPQAQQASYGYQQQQEANGVGYQPQPVPIPGNSAGATGWLSSRGAQQAAAAVGGAPANLAIQGRIVDFYTDWCGPCRAFEPLFYRMQAKYSNSLQFQRVNAEAQGMERLVKKYRVKGYPTIVLMDVNGNVKQRIEGAPRTLEEFESIITATYPKAASN